MGSAANALERQSAEVLICDDTQAIRRLLRVVLGDAGYHTVGEAADGLEAIAQARRLQPDVILLDLAMPRLSGLDALPDLRCVAPAAKIVVLSGFATPVVAAQVVDLGASCYVQKGGAVALIIAAIDHALAKPGAALASAFQP